MPLQISPFGNSQFLDLNGNPASGYQLFVYAGRTATKLTTYSDINGVGQQTNPIVLTASGQPAAPIYIDTALSYKFVLAAPTDTDPPTSPLYTVDQVNVGIQVPTVSTAEWTAGTTPTYVAATQFSIVGNQTVLYHIGRRVKCVINSGTLYGTITNSVFGAATTVTVALDAGALDNTLSAVSYGFLSASGSSWPAGFNTGLTTTLSGALVIPIASSFNLLQAGSIFPFAGTSTPPAGYLLCNGATVSRTTYATLFGAIGATFGAGDGSTTFGLPNIANLAPNVPYIIRYA